MFRVRQEVGALTWPCPGGLAQGKLAPSLGLGAAPSSPSSPSACSGGHCKSTRSEAPGVGGGQPCFTSPSTPKGSVRWGWATEETGGEEQQVVPGGEGAVGIVLP